MDKSRLLTWGHVLAAALGAVAGGLAVAIATRAVPAMMSRIETMGNAMMRMGGEGCDPEEM